MTEERKQYLASISKEERAIRDMLLILKSEIKTTKVYLSHEPNNKIKKDDLYFFNIIIKALKKRLPARVKKTKDFYDFYSYDCSVCGTPIETFNDKYCGNCGQKLR